MGGEIAERLMASDIDRDLLQNSIETKKHPFWPEFDTLVKKFFVAVEAAKEAILEWMCDITIPAQPKFIVAEKFTKDNTEVKFWHFGSNFMTWFGPMTEGETLETKVSVNRLRIKAKFADMTPELSEPRLVTVSQLYWMLQQQPKGEKSNGKNRRLLVNGYVNLLRIPDKDGIERSVIVYWHDGGGWYVYADGLESEDEWDAGLQVVSSK